MQSMKEALKGFDMEFIRKKAEEYRQNPKSQESTPANGTIPTYRCQECRDEGGTFVKQPVTQTVKGELVEVMMDHWTVCSCVERGRVEKMMRASQITDAFRDKTFNNFYHQVMPQPIQEAFRKAWVYYNRFDAVQKTANNGIMLMGRPGCGKTHLLAAITNGLMDGGHEVLYVPWVETMEMVKDDMSKEDVNNKRFEKMQTVEVLYIDDLFKPPAQPSAYEIKKLFQVINYRYQERKPILISTERDMEYLLSLDEGLGSRLKEMCHDFRVEIHGGRELNYRLREEPA